MKHAGTRVWIELNRHPSIGVVRIGVAAIAVASAIGAAEIAIGVAAGYSAYPVLREGVAPGGGRPEGGRGDRGAGLIAGRPGVAIGDSS